jgi:hypothetical protein
MRIKGGVCLVAPNTSSRSQLENNIIIIPPALVALVQAPSTELLVHSCSVHSLPEPECPPPRHSAYWQADRRGRVIFKAQRRHAVVSSQAVK